MKKCLLCGNTLSDSVIFKCHNLPESAQNIPDENEIEFDKGVNLNLCQCKFCGLVQFDCEPVDYYRDVIRAGGFSSTMIELRKNQYQYFIEKFKLKNKKIIEIGCGKGEFLKVLTEFPVRAFGIENKPDLVKAANDAGLNVSRDFADSPSKKLKNAPFDAFLSFNFMEHQPDPNAMMRCIYNNLTENGYGLITVPSFEYILENNSFYELLHDHIANYTKDTLRFLVEKNGFVMLECERINRDTWSMIVQKRPVTDVSGLRNNFETLSKQMQNFVEEKSKNGKKIAVWGASHQGFTALSTTGVSENISYIIDSAPFKQNRYSPATHIKIVSPDYFFNEPVDTILIIAPGYTSEIANLIKNKYGENIEVFSLKSALIEKIGV